MNMADALLSPPVAVAMYAASAAAAGICAAVFFGFLVAVIFKSRDKSK